MRPNKFVDGDGCLRGFCTGVIINGLCSTCKSDPNKPGALEESEKEMKFAFIGALSANINRFIGGIIRLRESAS